MLKKVVRVEKWTTEMIGPLLGKTALVTGGTEGTGLEVARELARNGARVIICAEDVTQGETALLDIRSSMQGALISYEHVDLADLESVKDFSDKFRIEHDQLHILINNAEISGLPAKIKSAQGHELMFAKNYLSHFALTARLFPLIEDTPDARIIFQSSLEHEKGVMDFFDLNASLYYETHKAYAQSKLAILIFARELDRRLRLTNLDVKSIPVHSGGFHTPFLSKFLNYAIGQSVHQAALPVLFAATSPDAMSGHYYGPDGFNGTRGYPIEVDCAIHAKNIQAAEKLWEVSENMTGVDFILRDMSNVLTFQMRGSIHPESLT
jgi:NAD(P)-dependent dehydrogenase (short-subunit alcohol dehydrogenase family)